MGLDIFFGECQKINKTEKNKIQNACLKRNDAILHNTILLSDDPRNKVLFDKMQEFSFPIHIYEIDWSRAFSVLGKNYSEFDCIDYDEFSKCYLFLKKGINIKHERIREKPNSPILNAAETKIIIPEKWSMQYEQLYENAMLVFKEIFWYGANLLPKYQRILYRNDNIKFAFKGDTIVDSIVNGIPFSRDRAKFCTYLNKMDGAEFIQIER